MEKIMSETMKSFISAFGLFMLILLLVFLLAVLTPRIAKLVDRLIDRFFRNRKTSRDDSIYGVRSIYDIPPDAPMRNGGDDDTVNQNKDGEIENGKE